MNKLIYIVLIASLIQGCGTMANLSEEEPSPYGGVKETNRLLNRGCYYVDCIALAIAYPFLWLDLPLSFSLDTATLPYTALSPLFKSKGNEGYVAYRSKSFEPCFVGLKLMWNERANLDVGESGFQCYIKDKRNNCMSSSGYWRRDENKIIYYGDQSFIYGYFVFDAGSEGLVYKGGRDLESGTAIKMAQYCVKNVHLEVVDEKGSPD